MGDELKPCPFCNAPGIIEQMPERSRQYPHFPMCSRCAVTMGGYETEKKAVTAWNKRPIEDNLFARTKTLFAQWDAVPWEVLCFLVDGYGQQFSDDRISDEEAEYLDVVRVWIDIHAPKKTEA